MESQVEFLSVSIKNKYFRYLQFLVQHVRSLEVVRSIVTIRKKSEQPDSQQLFLDLSEN